MLSLAAWYILTDVSEELAASNHQGPDDEGSKLL
jgi:hypothetical protein